MPSWPLFIIILDFFYRLAWLFLVGLGAKHIKIERKIIYTAIFDHFCLIWIWVQTPLPLKKCPNGSRKNVSWKINPPPPPFGQGAAEIVSHCIVNKQMPSASSYMICPPPDCDWSIKIPSIIWFGWQVLI